MTDVVTVLPLLPDPGGGAGNTEIAGRGSDSYRCYRCYRRIQRGRYPHTGAREPHARYTTLYRKHGNKGNSNRGPPSPVSVFVLPASPGGYGNAGNRRLVR